MSGCSNSESTCKSTCGDYEVKYGGYDEFGSNGVVKIDVNSMPGHWGLFMNITYIKIDEWNNQAITFSVDGMA